MYWVLPIVGARCINTSKSQAAYGNVSKAFVNRDQMGVEGAVAHHTISFLSSSRKSVHCINRMTWPTELNGANIAVFMNIHCCALCVCDRYYYNRTPRTLWVQVVVTSGGRALGCDKIRYCLVTRSLWAPQGRRRGVSPYLMFFFLFLFSYPSVYLSFSLRLLSSRRV